MKRGAILAGAALLALTSALAIAQNAPESLLPPGFDKPRPKPSAPAVNKASGNAPMAVSTPVVQPLPGAYQYRQHVTAGCASSSRRRACVMTSSASRLLHPGHCRNSLLPRKPPFDATNARAITCVRRCETDCCIGWMSSCRRASPPPA